MNRTLCVAAFAVGLAAVGWVGRGYVGTNALALTMTALIGAFYLMGALELRRFQQATTSLRSALAALAEPLPDIGGWLAGVHPSLQNAVRLRIEGERVALPGPAMTPYLVGLLVLLGMLGTFLGMVVTLNGAVLALESTTDLATIRAALAAPVKGLGLAFGTSVAGVAASAMLGLVSALCRRDRLEAAQLLDARSGSRLNLHSQAHQRRETLATLQAQSRLMPELVGQMQAAMAQMERQHAGLSEQLTAGQERFYRHAQTAYTELASSVDQSLRHSLGESARSAGETIQPMVAAAMAGITRETALFQQRMADSVAQQLDGLATRFDTAVTTVAGGWTASLAEHQRSSEALTRGLDRSLGRFAETFEQRSASLLATVQGHHADWQTDLKAQLVDLTGQTTALHERVAGTIQTQLDGVTERFGATAATVSDGWQGALAEHRRSSDSLATGLQQSLGAWVKAFEQQTASLLHTVEGAHTALRADSAAGDQQRLSAWTQQLAAMAESLQREWQQAGVQALGQQEQMVRTLERTAQALHAQAESQTTRTIGEMSRLIDTASEAPRAASELLALVQRTVSDSTGRDNDLLAERTRILGTLNALLDTVNHSVGEQRGAIDSLVASSSALLESAGTQFSERLDAESSKMAAAATQVTASAIDVASMGEAFSAGVQLFGESNEALIEQLRRIEAALGKSTARSDEQLAYYVAQARELIDLSISSQKQIVEDLQQLAIRQAPVTGETA